MTCLLPRLLASLATLLVAAHAHAYEAGWMQEIYAEPIKPSLVTARIRQIRDAGVAAAASVTPQRTNQLLPALTAVLTGGAVALDRLGHGWAALALALDLFLMGFAGTQRVWFLRGFRYRSLDPDEIWSMNLTFIPRFLLLGLVTLVLFVATWLVSALIWKLRGIEQRWSGSLERG